MSACKKCFIDLCFPTSLRTGLCVVCRAADQRVGPQGPVILPAVAGPFTQSLHGVGPDAPTTVNGHGGKQSSSPYRADLLPPHALLAVARVMASGAQKYGPNNWHLISATENVNHAMVHLLARSAGDESDAHLEHAATRILFALDQVLSGRGAALAAKIGGDA